MMIQQMPVDRKGQIRLGITVSLGAILVSLAAGCGGSGSYRYTPHEMKPLPARAATSIAVFPMDYPFRQGLISSSKTGDTIQNAQKLTSKGADFFYNWRDLYGLCLWQDIEAQSERWIQEVRFGPNPAMTKYGDERERFNDLVLRGRMDIYLDEDDREKDKRPGGTIQLVLTLSAPGDPAYVRYYRTSFEVPEFEGREEGKIMSTFREVNKGVMSWLQQELSQLDPAFFARSREQVALAQMGHVDSELFSFNKALRTRLNRDADRSELRQLVHQCYEKWESLGVLRFYEVDVLRAEAKSASDYYSNVADVWAEAYKKRDRKIAGARALQTALILTAAAAAAADAYAQSQNQYRGQSYRYSQQFTQAIVASAVIGSIAIERNMKQEVARLMGSIPFRAGGVHARLSSKAKKLLQAAQRASTPEQAFDLMRATYAQIQGDATFEVFESGYHQPENDVTAAGEETAG